MKLVGKQIIAAIVILALVHVGLGLLPDPPFSMAMNLVLFFTNLFVFHAAAVTLGRRTGRAVGLFLVGYFVLFLLVVVVLGKTPLFILLIVVYASLFASAPLLGFFAIFVLSFVLLQPYAFESFIPLALIYGALMYVRRVTSRFVQICLGGGLLALAIVLFPLIHLTLEDSAQTLWRTFIRPEVREALWTSLWSSTLATVVVGRAVGTWGALIAGVAVGKHPHEIRFSPDRRLAYVSDNGILWMTDPGEGGPLGIGLDGSNQSNALRPLETPYHVLAPPAQTGNSGVNHDRFLACTKVLLPPHSSMDYDTIR